MENPFVRTEGLLGKKSMEKLKTSRVAVFGIGGVGGYVVEALARCGIGALDLIDPDRVAVSNLNRQIFALHSTLGRYKTDAAMERVRDISPDTEVHGYRLFYGPDTAQTLDLSRYDYVVDAVDTVTAKILLVTRAKEAGTPVISSMGAGNKLDPGAFEVADLYETSVCPLARVMRRELKRRGIRELKVVYSREKPRTPDSCGEDSVRRSPVPGSVSFVPAAAGLLLAGEVVKDLIG